jgi:hypothetical protein
VLDPVTLPTVDLTLIAGIGLAFPRCAHTSQSDIEDALIRRALRGSTLRIDPALGAAAPEAALSGKKDFRASAMSLFFLAAMLFAVCSETPSLTA